MFTRVRKSSIINIIIACAFLIGVAHISNRSITKEETLPALFIPLKEEAESVEPSTNNDIEISSSFETGATSKSIDGYFINDHCAYPNVIERSIKETNRITLILHISYDRLTSDIIQQINNWDGPISLAVVFSYQFDYRAKQIKCITNFLNILQNNHTGAAEKLSAHILIQSQKGKKCGTIINEGTDETELDYVDCKDKKASTQRELIKKMAHYAVNDARNLARNLSTTKYILIADMDHFFSKNFESKMLGLADAMLDKDRKTVLVYRIFEVDENVTKMPETKEELQILLRKNQAQEFHKFYGAHNIPKLQEWFKRPDHGSYNTSIQYYRKYASFHWEPQFVSLTDIPFHDPKFFYSLRDNTVLRWEMCRAGYKFAIVDDVFMYHPGIKTRKQNKLIDKVRSIVRPWSWGSLRAFNRRMDATYPETKKVCPNLKTF